MHVSTLRMKIQKKIEELIRIIDAQCFKPLVIANSSKLQTEEKISNQHEKELIDGFGKLWTTGKFSDFVIIVNGSKEFRVHKCVLAIQSVGFAEMFDSDENASEMKIEDLNAEAVEEFLRFLYTGKLANKTKNSFELLALASKLKVHELKSLTEEMILSDLDDTNAYKVFTLGHRYESETMKTAAFEEIRKMFPDKKLADDLVENLEKVKQLIEAKLKFESLFQELNHPSFH
jgi:BTB/POZ domain